ncbi:MAG: hypothetical protein HY209_06485 [Candidatus Omnitrophica bacterium]|nr:hypothetical protein [Candidatus Omnitrophota bacterium]
MGDLQGMVAVPAKAVLAQVGQFVSNLLLVLLLLLAGWLISKLIVKTGVTKLLKLLKLDDLSRRIELDRILAKGGINSSLSELTGEICYWIALLTTLVVALNAVGLSVVADLLQKIVLYIPNIIVAVFILIVGMFAAVIMKNIVKTAASNVGISQVNFLARLTEIVVLIFTVAIALEQLQIGAKIVELTITIILSALGLGFALAFGLGCKDIVGKSVAEFLDKLKR